MRTIAGVCHYATLLICPPGGASNPTAPCRRPGGAQAAPKRRPGGAPAAPRRRPGGTPANPAWRPARPRPTLPKRGANARQLPRDALHVSVRSDPLACSRRPVPRPPAACRPPRRCATLWKRRDEATRGDLGPSGQRRTSGGRLAQRESASFTPRRSLVRSQYRPPGQRPCGSPSSSRWEPFL